MNDLAGALVFMLALMLINQHAARRMQQQAKYALAAAGPATSEEDT